MEIIELPGYTQEEKLAIATRYLVQRQLTANGLDESQVAVTEAALTAVIDGYTREAGVRNLERDIGALLRHAAMRIAEGATEKVTIDAADVPAILGARRFENEVKLRTSVPGVATGLAWTPVGGDILFIEATLVPGGKGSLILTGQLGDVMKESAQAAVSLAKTRMDKLGADPALLEKNDLHIHFPAGAIPKDGPSAGVATFLAVASLLSGRTVRADVAMTGEISLRGLVLPIGGVKEKTLAALRAGIDTVLLPARNKKDLEEIPENARKRLEFVWLDDIDDALAAALEAPARAADGDAPRRERSGEGKGGPPRITAH
jgi:ATP-dependent Lon protease